MSIEIDMLGSARWSEADIRRRVAAMIESDLFSVTDAQAAGDAARTDMAELQAAFDYEAAVRRLAQSAVTEPLTVTSFTEDGDPVEVPNAALALDASERADAEALIAGASEATLALVAQRTPPPDVDEFPAIDEGIEG